MKRCSKCGTHKPVSEFWRDSRRPDGRYQHCKPCAKDMQIRWRAANPGKVAATQRRNNDKRRGTGKQQVAHRKHRYGLAPEAYDALLIGQLGCCALCGSPMVRLREPAVDHDHVDGRVRALLCSMCNKGLGHFYDSPALLRAGAAYLEEHAST